MCSECGSTSCRPPKEPLEEGKQTKIYYGVSVVTCIPRCHALRIFWILFALSRLVLAPCICKCLSPRPASMVMAGAALSAACDLGFLRPLRGESHQPLKSCPNNPCAKMCIVFAAYHVKSFCLRYMPWGKATAVFLRLVFVRVVCLW